MSGTEAAIWCDECTAISCRGDCWVFLRCVKLSFLWKAYIVLILILLYYIILGFDMNMYTILTHKCHKNIKVLLHLYEKWVSEKMIFLPQVVGLVWLCDFVTVCLRPPCSVQRVVPGFRCAGVSDGSPGGSEGHRADHLLGSAPAVHRGPLQSVGAGHHAHRQPEEVNARPRKRVTSLVGRRCRCRAGLTDGLCLPLQVVLQKTLRRQHRHLLLVGSAGTQVSGVELPLPLPLPLDTEHACCPDPDHTAVDMQTLIRFENFQQTTCISEVY